VKTRGLIDLHPVEPGNLLAALGQSDLEGIFREATIYKSGVRGSGNGPALLMQGSVPRDLSRIDDWHVSLPLSILDFRILSLPFSDPATIAKVIPHELDNLIFGGSQDVVSDFVVLKNLEKGSEILVVYLKKKPLQGLLDALSRAGIDPRVVTSVELRAVLDASPEGIAEFVTGRTGITHEGRLSAVKAELKDLPLVNLRSGRFSYRRGTEQLWKAARITAALLFALGVLIQSLIGIGTITARTESSSIKETLRKEYSQLFPQERKVSDELYQLKSHVKGLRDKRTGLIGAAPLRVLKMMSESRVQGTYLTEVTIDPISVVVRGEAPSVAGAESLKSRLAPYLSDPSVSDIRPITEGRTSFTLSAGVTSP
jgi:hypothetical protein